MFILKVKSTVRAGCGDTCLCPHTWEEVFTGKEDQQFKVSLSYTVGLSPAWDTWGQPRICLYKEHVWEWSLMDLEHEEKNISFDHMLTSARESRFKFCIHRLVEAFLLFWLADRLKTRVYKWNESDSKGKIPKSRGYKHWWETVSCSQPCPRDKRVQEVPWSWDVHEVERHGSNPLWGYVLTVSYKSRRRSHQDEPLALRNNAWNTERQSSRCPQLPEER